MLFRCVWRLGSVVGILLQGQQVLHSKEDFTKRIYEVYL